METLKTILLDRTAPIKAVAYEYVLKYPDQFKHLVEWSFSEEQPVAWRAAWILGHFLRHKPEFIPQMQSSVPRIISAFTNFNSPGQIREYLKIIQLLDVDEEQMGYLLDLCFQWLIDRKSDEAFRIYSMQIIFDYAKKEPDLFPELQAIIEQEMEWAKPGFKSRGKKILKYISKI